MLEVMGEGGGAGSGGQTRADDINSLAFFFYSLFVNSPRHSLTLLSSMTEYLWFQPTLKTLSSESRSTQPCLDPSWSPSRAAW